jgi:protein SCO1
MRAAALVAFAAITAGCSFVADDSTLPYYVGAEFTPIWTATAPRTPPFLLTAQNGARVSGSELRGHIHVASFIYTRCSVICPVLLDRLQAVQIAAAAWPDVEIVSFSVAPQYDTPETLAAFGREHRIEPARWKLLTGDRRQIAEAARTFYYADDGRGSGDELLHSERVVLVDRHGRLRGVYNGTLRADIDRLIADVRVLRPANE